jgi:hypothetical protein
MSEETLMTAAHRANRFFRMDMQAGGLIVDETLAAIRTLARQVELATSHVWEPGTGPTPADDALLKASRDAVRDLDIDQAKHGGLISIKTEISFDWLAKAINGAGGRK